MKRKDGYGWVLGRPNQRPMERSILNSVFRMVTLVKGRPIT